MINQLAGNFAGVPFKYLGDWTDRIASGELPKDKPAAPMGGGGGGVKGQSRVAANRLSPGMTALAIALHVVVIAMAPTATGHATFAVSDPCNRVDLQAPRFPSLASTWRGRRYLRPFRIALATTTALAISP